MRLESKTFFTIPEWAQIPFLVHGFGNRHWKLADFDGHPRLRNFKPVFLRQIHSGFYHIVDDIPGERLAGDALLTVRRGLLLVIKTADCLPVLIVDQKKKAIAAVHCGWKSTSQGLVQKVIAGLEGQFLCDPSSLKVAFGPCIGKNCYEVGEDVKQEFADRDLDRGVFLPHPLHMGRYYLDLRMANKHQLVDSGVKDSNISLVNLCTHCEENLLSYRRSRQTESRMLSFIGITSS